MQRLIFCASLNEKDPSIILNKQPNEESVEIQWIIVSYIWHLIHL